MIAPQPEPPRGPIVSKPLVKRCPASVSRLRELLRPQHHFDSANPESQAAFWAAVTGHAASDVTRPGNSFWLVAPPLDEDGIRLAFVPAGEPKNGKNRVHVVEGD